MYTFSFSLHVELDGGAARRSGCLLVASLNSGMAGMISWVGGFRAMALQIGCFCSTTELSNCESGMNRYRLC